MDMVSLVFLSCISMGKIMKDKWLDIYTLVMIREYSRRKWFYIGLILLNNETINIVYKTGTMPITYFSPVNFEVWKNFENY